MKKFSFNKIIVIESLADNEVQTGSNLFNDLLNRKSGILSELKIFKTKVELLAYFEELKEEIKINGILPFLHFEIHGSKNKDGLVMSSGELVGWLELANRFRELNQILNNNLFVSLATCHGAYMYREISPTQSSPLFGFIGPWQEVESDDIEVSFNYFFDCLISENNFTEAVKRLNDMNNLPYRYHFYSAEEIFDRVYDQYEKRDYSPENYKQRVLYLMSEALKDYNVRTTFTIDQVRDFVENMLNDKDHFRTTYKARFLIEPTKLS